MTENEFVLPAFKGGISLTVKNGKIFEVSLRDSPPTKVGGSGKVVRDLRSYFSGNIVNFRGYDVNFSGYTDFQKRVLKATQRIPYGKTMSYKEVAEVVGSPKAARAVGQVMARNRTCIFIPCHRVVGTDGIGGFTGSIEWKRDLLRLEGSLSRLETSSRHTRSRASKHRRL